MAGLGDTYTTEVYGQDIEGSIRRTLEDASQTTYERVGSVGGHGIYHQASGSASAKRFHDGGRESAYEVAVDATELHEAFYTAY